MKTADTLQLEGSEMMSAALDYWFADQGHVRTPFPVRIQAALRPIAIEKFGKWLKGLNEKAKTEVNDEILAEKFEEVLFESALGMVSDEEERITLLYPFLPRPGDQVTAPDAASGSLSTVTSRKLTSEGDLKFMELHLQEAGGREWSTQFQLPG